MNEPMSNFFPILLMAFLAGLTYWLDQVVQMPSATNNPLLRHDPDYIVDGLVATRLGLNGQIKNTLRSNRLTHFPDEDVTVLENLHLINYDAASPMTITAKKGLLSSNAGDIYFQESVRLVRAPYANKSELVIDTHYLHVMPDDHEVSTNQPVVITDDNMRIQASSMQMNTEMQSLRLGPAVKVTYYDASRYGKKPLHE